MQPPNSESTTRPETPAKGTLEGLLRLLGGGAPPPPQRTQIDPEKARAALKALVRPILADDERGRRARAALKRMGEGALELLRVLSG